MTAAVATGDAAERDVGEDRADVGAPHMPRTKMASTVYTRSMKLQS